MMCGEGEGRGWRGNGEEDEANRRNYSETGM